MPNIGRPSKDCHLCRKRRVKCDLGRPGCQRCVKYGVECPGYRDQQELIFRNANPASLKKRKKTAAAAAATKAEAVAEGSQDGNDHSSPHSTSSSSDSSSPSSGTVKKRPTKDAAVGIKPIDPTFAIAVASGIPPGVHQHWTEHSVPIVLNIYSTFDFLATMYQRHGTEGPLLWAAHLFSRTYIHNLRAPASSRMNTQQDIQNELAGYMNKALRGIGDALQTREGVMRDDILLTVWILTNYELLMGSLRRNQLHSPWFLHTRGLRSLLKARGSKPLYTPKGRAAFWPAFTVVQINAMVTNVECPPESAEWLKIIRERMYPEEEPDYHCSLFILRATQVIYRILDIFRNRDFLAASLEYNQLYQTVLDAEKDYDEYIAKNPNVVEARRYMQNLQRSGSIKAHRYLNLLANFLTHYPYNQIPLEQLQMERNYSVRRVRTEAQAILDCIPVALSPASLGVEDSPRYLFNALRLCWPLQAVYVIKTTLPEQKREAERALLHMGTQMGVRQALRWRRAPRFYPEEAERPLGLVELEGSDEQSYQGMAQNEPMHPDFEDRRVIETYH